MAGRKRGKEEVQKRPIPAARKPKDAIEEALARRGYTREDIFVKKDMGDYWRIVLVDAMKLDVPK